MNNQYEKLKSKQRKTNSKRVREKRIFVRFGCC